MSAGKYSFRVSQTSNERREELLMRHTAWALCILAAASAWADVPTYNAEPSQQFFKDWLICGPLPLAGPDGKVDAIRLPGMYKDYLGREGTAPIAEGQAVAFDGGQCAWKRYTSPEDVVSLDDAVSNQGTGVAYAYCEIQSADAKPGVLALGSNDGVRVWFNGENVWENPGSRGLKRDGDLIPVLLHAGKNTLLVKVEERGNKWQLSARMLPLDSAALADRFKLFDVICADDGTAILRFRQSLEFFQTLVNKVTLEAATAADPTKAVWTGEWSASKETTLGVPKDRYADYILRAKLEMKEGAPQCVEFPFAAGKREEHVLFADGKTEYTIVLPDDANEGTKWAAQELQHWLKEVSGADFPLKNAADGKVIRLNGPVQADIAVDDAFGYESAGDAININGKGPRGTMYGIMSFLEREMGVRFYTPRVTVTPKKTKYAFVTLQHNEKPGVRVRNDFYYEAFDPIWAAHNRVNGSMDARQQPGGLESYWAVHTFFPLMPPDEFFATHPEYYSLIDGKRQADHAQLCLTNPDVLRIITERIKQKMRDLPQYLIYDVSQNDWANPCQCDQCQAIAKAEGSESGVVIWFVNQVADAVKVEFPDKFIGTLAYQYTRKPPASIKPRENVVVRLCSIECCFAHDFQSCPENKSFVEDTENWAKLAPHIYVWDYVVNFSHYIMPYPNFRVLQPNIQFFRDHNAIGIMEQAAYQSRGGEFAELRAYVISKLLWNPEANVPEIVDDFMYGYYGRAGQFVKAYFDLLHGRITPDTHIHLGTPPEDPLFSDDFIRESKALFDRAEAVADTEEIRQRVEMARLPIMYLECRRNPIEAKQNGTYARFSQIVEREGITNYAEDTAQKPAFHEFVENAK
jgi:hypothetical protein